MSTSVLTPPRNGDELLERLRQATLGRYDIYAELGRGGMAAVFLALDLALNRKVALKVILPELLQGHGGHERFRREARTAASLSHPHIIPVYAVGEDEGLAWFAMKFVDGRSLDSVLVEEGPQTPAFVKAMLRQVGSALDYAHRRGVIHRDIKPANILLDEGGWFVLTDFGIAKAADDVALTSSGMLIGTPAYMSPEHFEGKVVGAAADQYALGCVAYELLAGVRPFQCATVAELMRAHVLDEPTRLEYVRSDCPPALSRVVARALSKAPAARFASADELVHALDAPTGEEQREVTEQIVSLARNGAESRPRISEPVSPVPLNRPPTESAANASMPRPLRGRSALVVGALALLAMAIRYGATAGAPRAVTPTTPEPSNAAVDTYVPSPSILAGGTDALDGRSASAPPVSTPALDPPAVRVRANTDQQGGKPAAVLARANRAAADTAFQRSPDTAEVAVPAGRDTVATGTTGTPVPDPPALSWFSIKLLFPDLTLYVDGQLQRVDKQRTVFVPVTPGRHVIEVRRNECTSPFIDARVFAAGDTVRYNNKGPCPEGL